MRFNIRVIFITYIFIIILSCNILNKNETQFETGIYFLNQQELISVIKDIPMVKYFGNGSYETAPWHCIGGCGVAGNSVKGLEKGHKGLWKFEENYLTLIDTCHGFESAETTIYKIEFINNGYQFYERNDYFDKTFLRVFERRGNENTKWDKFIECKDNANE